MNKIALIPPVAAIALALPACTPESKEAKPVQPAFKPAASIQHLMAAIIAPSADALSESVSTETTLKGVEEKQPRTEQEWQQVRRHAIALLEAGNLLIIDRRAVAHPGKVTEDAEVPGVSHRRRYARPSTPGAANFTLPRALQDAAATP